MSIEKERKLICKKCKLFNDKENVCSVVVVKDGEKFELKTHPNNECFWEKNNIEVQEIKIWSDGKDGYIEINETKD